MFLVGVAILYFGKFQFTFDWQLTERLFYSLVFPYNIHITFEFTNTQSVHKEIEHLLSKLEGRLEKQPK